MMSLEVLFPMYPIPMGHLFPGIPNTSHPPEELGPGAQLALIVADDLQDVLIFCDKQARFQGLPVSSKCMPKLQFLMYPILIPNN